MSIACLLGKHSPLPSELHNQGFYFSRCACCGADMVRSKGAWRVVPDGFRVVWRTARHADEAAAAQLAFEFPPAGGAIVPWSGRPTQRLDLASLWLVAGWRRLADFVARIFLTLTARLEPGDHILRLPAP